MIRIALSSAALFSLALSVQAADPASASNSLPSPNSPAWAEPAPPAPPAPPAAARPTPQATTLSTPATPVAPSASVAPPAAMPAGPGVVPGAGYPSPNYVEMVPPPTGGPGCQCNGGLPGRHYSAGSYPLPASQPSTGVVGIGGFYGPLGYPGYPGMYTGAYANGMHPRYPYYSYRAPWYSPGPAGANVSIMW